jgi:hypothetical protein
MVGFITSSAAIATVLLLATGVLADVDPIVIKVIDRRLVTASS